MNQLSDKELLELFNDEESRNYAFNLLVRQYQKPLYGYIRRMLVEHQDAQDVLQNTFIKAWKGLAAFRQDSKLYSWLYRIAHNETLNYIKKQKKGRFSRDEKQLEKACGIVRNELEFSGEEIQRKLQNAVNTLPEKQRAVFVMKYFEELRFVDIAEITGTSVGALKSSFHIAVKKIEAILTSDQTKAS